VADNLSPADRIALLTREGLDIIRRQSHPVSSEKARLLTDAFRRNEGYPAGLRAARVLAEILEKCTIRIDAEELVVGNVSRDPWGLEATHLWATWPEAELEALVEDGYQISDETLAELRELNDFWRGRTLTSRMTQIYDDERVWPYAQVGIVLPPYREKAEGWGGGGMLGVGYGVHHEISQLSCVPRFDLLLELGFGGLLEQARAELSATRITSAEAIEKRDFLNSVIVTLEAGIAFATRFAAEARRQAAEHTGRRRDELLAIADICDHVPAGPARTLHEALQSYWFATLLMLPSNVLGMGRLDQIFDRYYQADLAAGRLDAERAVELFACLRAKTTQVLITGGTAHRAKWAAGTKWLHAVIGGVTPDGADATNDTTYLVLEAARLCPTPHHTLTLRVHEGTPDRLWDAALDLLGTGIGLPALVGDAGNIAHLVANGVPVEQARDYGMGGDLTISVPGDSRFAAGPMMVAPRILEIAIAGGWDPRTQRQVGPATRPLDQHEDFEDFVADLEVQMRHFISLQAEFNNVTLRAMAEQYPHTVASVLMNDAFSVGRGVMQRGFVYDNASGINPIGMVDVADSLASIRETVFAGGHWTAADLRAALAADWVGYEELREDCRRAARYGRGDSGADALLVRLYRTWAEAAVEHTNSYGGNFLPAGITIGTSNTPGGELTGATPNGRGAYEPLTTEALTPAPASEGVTVATTVDSALAVDQVPWAAIALDLGVMAEAFVAGRAELRAELARYLENGGRHVQLNVVDPERLARIQGGEDGVEQVVRLGGTSSYFGQMSPTLQEHFLRRRFHEEVRR
jgi:Pyruvate-formate lyase